MPGFCPVFQSDGVDLVQTEDMQLDALMDAGRWIYLTSVKPDAVLFSGTIPSKNPERQQEKYIENFKRGTDGIKPLRISIIIFKERK